MFVVSFFEEKNFVGFCGNRIGLGMTERLKLPDKKNIVSLPY